MASDFNYWDWCQPLCPSFAKNSILRHIKPAMTRQPIAVSDISIYICLIDIRSKSKEQLNERRAGLSSYDHFVSTEHGALHESRLFSLHETYWALELCCSLIPCLLLYNSFYLSGNIGGKTINASQHWLAQSEWLSWQASNVVASEIFYCLMALKWWTLIRTSMVTGSWLCCKLVMTAGSAWKEQSLKSSSGTNGTD